jgi:acetylornithine deacetylase/succinyl-diaminopimelate desuccinylase-like protein
VVTTAGQSWTHPPFEGRLEDGFVWGRGALDMKAGVAMLVNAFARAKREGVRLPGDVVLIVLSDEENGGNLGARYLVEEHPELFEGMRYALGEFGGFTLHAGGKRFYPIQVGEKQICWLKATIRGPGGHGAMINRGGTVARLARFLSDLDRKRLPVHVTPIVREMVEAIASALPRHQAAVMRSLLKPRFTDGALRLLGAQGAMFEPMLRNTVNATIVRGGSKINVVPSEIEVELDGRALPGFSPEQLIAELHELVGKDIELELVRHDPGPAAPDLGLFELLADVIRELDPEGIPIPLLQIGVTDGRFFSRAGIQTYGFLPMRLPPDFAFTKLIHAADERIPVAALEFGAEAVWRAVQRFQ